MNTAITRIPSGYRSVCTKTVLFFERNITTFMLILGAVLLIGGLHELSQAQQNNQALATFSKAQYNDKGITAAVGNLFALIEGAFGALIMVISGLGAIVAAAMGAYRAAVGMLVVAVGAFVLRSLVSLFFGTGFTGFSGGAAANPTGTIN